jgi:hypothetical protein
MSDEKAAAYNAMMESWAWKDFQKEILDQIRREALEEAIRSDNPITIQVARGKVQAIDRIETDIGFILKPLEVK